jgi:malate/lactate dehydrogenase
MDSILIIGSAGSVGHDMMYQIACMKSDIKVVGADVNEEKGLFEIEESLQIAHKFGNYPDLSFRKINLFDIDGTSDLLEDLQPKVICNLASLGSWWVTRLLPMEEYKKIGPIGPWLPNHLTLTWKLMQAIKKSGIETRVVNGAFPDATNMVLKKAGYDIICGGGNMDLGVSRIQRIVARELKIPYRNVRVYGVGHHGSYYTTRLGGPYWLKIIANGEDVNEQFPNEKITKLYQDAGYGAFSTYAGPLVDQMRTAASFLKNVLSIYYDTNEIVACVPGVNGLPGGYPARLNSEGAEVVLPDISLKEAIEINELGGRLDGIERIKDDGTVIYLDKNVEYMQEVVGYDCKELKLKETEERAKQLNDGLKRLYEKYKLN